MEKVQEFCHKAKEKGITFNAMVGCIQSIQSGQRMTAKERTACDFLGEPETFWNPVKHMDYNWFLDHQDEIRNELS